MKRLLLLAACFLALCSCTTPPSPGQGEFMESAIKEADKAVANYTFQNRPIYGLTLLQPVDLKKLPVLSTFPDRESGGTNIRIKDGNGEFDFGILTIKDGVLTRFQWYKMFDSSLDAGLLAVNLRKQVEIQYSPLTGDSWGQNPLLENDSGTSIYFRNDIDSWRSGFVSAYGDYLKKSPIARTPGLHPVLQDVSVTKVRLSSGKWAVSLGHATSKFWKARKATQGNR